MLNGRPDGRHLENTIERSLLAGDAAFCQIALGKGKDKVVYSSLRKRLTATGTHMPYVITQCYLPPGRGDIPAFIPKPKRVLDLATPEGCDAELTWFIG